MGFETVYGFIFSFVILMGVFIGIFAVYQDQITQQALILEQNNQESYFAQLQTDFEISSIFYSSGRNHFSLNNTGSDDLFFKQEDAECFDLFTNTNFISTEDIFLSIEGPLSAEYRFIEPKDEGVLVNRDSSMNFSQSNTFKIISCGGVEKDFTFEPGEQDWWNTLWINRSIFSVDNTASSSIAEYQIEIELNSSNFDFSIADEEEVRVVLPFKEQFALDIPMDSESQLMEDFSSRTVNVFLGNSSSTEDNDPTFNQDGILFGAYDFDGINDHILVSSSDSEILDDQFTFAVWVDWSSLGDNPQYLIYDVNTSTGVYLDNSGGGSDGQITFDLEVDSTIESLTSNSSVNASSWTFITAVYDGVYMNIYVDGKLNAQQLANGTLNFELDSTYIGSNSSAFFYNGTLDELRVLDISLTAQEVTDLYHNNLRFKELDYYISRWDESNELAFIYAKIPYLGSQENTSVHMYYNNAQSITSTQSINDTFSYRVARTFAYPVTRTHWQSTGLSLTSLYDENTIFVGNTKFNLDEFAFSTIGSGSLNGNEEIRATHLTQVEGDGANADIVTPISWASTEFLMSGLRNSLDTYCMLSPWGTANVDIFEAGSPITTTLSVGNSVVCQQNNTADNTALRVSSDIPILFGYFGDTGDQDTITMYPATTLDLYGVPSQNLDFAAGPSGTSFTENEAGTTSTVNLPANGDGNDGGNGNDAGGNPFRLSDITFPIGAIQQGDSDGSESTTFGPEKEMGVFFGSQESIEYVVGVSPHIDANCSTFTSAGLVENIPTGTGGTGVYKYGFDVGNDVNYITQPWYLRCDKPVWPYYEKDTGTEETNLIGHLQMRQFIHPEPVISIIS